MVQIDLINTRNLTNTSSLFSVDSYFVKNLAYEIKDSDDIDQTQNASAPL
jgi:hypothetical protein